MHAAAWTSSLKQMRDRSPSQDCGITLPGAPHERLPEILVAPREKTPTGAALVPIGDDIIAALKKEHPWYASCIRP